MLKRVLSVFLSLVLVFSCLGSIAITVSAATTVNENVKWNENFTNAYSANDNPALAFNQYASWLKSADGNNMFYRSSWSAYVADTFVTYLEEVDGNRVLYYKPTIPASSSESIRFLRTFGNAQEGGLSTGSWSYDSLKDTTCATSGAWTFSFDFKPIKSGFKFAINSYVAQGDVKTLFIYDDGAAKFLNNAFSVSLTENELYKIAFSADGTGNVDVYVNGKKINSASSASYWSKLVYFNISFENISGKLGEYYLDNFKVSDQATGFYGAGSAFDAMATSSLFSIKDTASNGGATSTVVISEEAAGETSAQEFCDSLTLSSTAPEAAPVLYGNDGEEIDDYEAVMMSDVDKMIVGTGYTSREYDIFVELDTFASSKYSVSHSNKTVSGVTSNIKVSDFLDDFSPITDATVNVKRGDALLTGDDQVVEGDVLVSSYAGNEYTYSIGFIKYWEEDFGAASAISGATDYNGNNLKYSDGSPVFDYYNRYVRRISTDEPTYFYFDGTNYNYEGNAVSPSWYTNTINEGELRIWFGAGAGAAKNEADVKIHTTLKHSLKSDGKSSGSPITTSGAYNFEFSFRAYDGRDDFSFDMAGVKSDDSEFSYIGYNEGTFKAFGTDITPAPALGANGYYNCKIEYLGNGFSNVYINGTKVAENIAGGADVKAVALNVIAKCSWGDLRVDNIKMYPVVYEAPASTTKVTLYKDSVDDANIVNGKADLTATTKYIAKADIACYDASLPAMLVIAAYNGNALSKVICDDYTFTYGVTDDIQVEIDSSYVSGADRVCVFLWNGVTLKPFNFIEIK